jgi:hypothetical protein
MQTGALAAHRKSVVCMYLLWAVIYAMANQPAHATFHTYRISELYSNVDGSVQFIELKEAFGANGQNFLAGHTISVTQGQTTHTFTFPTNLPNGNTANTSVLIATPGFAQLGIVTPDYIVPDGFLFAGGSTVNYAGVDSLSYPSLPTDGVHSLYRDGTIATNLATNFAGQTGSVAAPPPPPPRAPGIPTLGPLGVLTLMLALIATARLALHAS